MTPFYEEDSACNGFGCLHLIRTRAIPVITPHNISFILESFPNHSRALPTRLSSVEMLHPNKAVSAQPTMTTP